MFRNTTQKLMFVALFVLVSLASCDRKKADDEKKAPPPVKVDFPGTMEGAKELVGAFLVEGVDGKAVSNALRPKPEDYAAVFSADAEAIQAKYDAMWEGGEVVINRDASQTELVLWASPSEGFLNMLEGDSQYFPGGYLKAAAHLKPGLTFYRFKFVAPGEELGMGWDGLVYVNGHWAVFPKPWRALPGYLPGDEVEQMFDSMSPYDIKKMMDEQQ